MDRLISCVRTTCTFMNFHKFFHLVVVNVCHEFVAVQFDERFYFFLFLRFQLFSLNEIVQLAENSEATKFGRCIILQTVDIPWCHCELSTTTLRFPCVFPAQTQSYAFRNFGTTERTFSISYRLQWCEKAIEISWLPRIYQPFGDVKYCRLVIRKRRFSFSVDFFLFISSAAIETLHQLMAEWIIVIINNQRQR